MDIIDSTAWILCLILVVCNLKLNGTYLQWLPDIGVIVITGIWLVSRL